MLRERITITVETELLTAIDSLIDQQTLRNRSQTIEHLLKEGLGLHELQQAFLFLQTTTSSELIERVVTFCLASGIKELLIGLPAGAASQFEILKQSIEPRAICIHVPTDFGTGGAVVLQKERLQHPFLLLTVDEKIQLPNSIIPMYAFHRLHHAPLTRLLSQATDTHYQPCQIEIASPELVTAIPAGLVDLIQDVFPVLVKEGKVRSYVS